MPRVRVACVHGARTGTSSRRPGTATGRATLRAAAMKPAQNRPRG